MLLIAYCRVANARQARSARSPGPLFDPAWQPVPGLEAQRSKVEQLRRQLEGGQAGRVAQLIGGAVEIEASPHRPQLARAIAAARKQGAYVVVAQLYGLARDADLLAQLAAEYDRDRPAREIAALDRAQWTGLQGFLFPDLPDPATPVRLLADLARFELEAPGRPAREGLQAAKARGVRLGGTRPGHAQENARTRAAAIDRAEQLRSLLTPLRAQGASLRAMAQAAAAAGVTTGKGEPLSASQIKRHLERLGLLAG